MFEEILTVGALREIMAHYRSSARVIVSVDLDDVDLVASHTTYGGDDPDRIVLRAATGHKVMLLSPAEQLAVEAMREK